MTTTMDDFLTELDPMDPKAIALVGKGANGFLNSAFIEKALAEVTEEAIKAFVDGLCGVDGLRGSVRARYDSLLRDRDFSFLEKAKLKAKERTRSPTPTSHFPGAATRSTTSPTPAMRCSTEPERHARREGQGARRGASPLPRHRCRHRGGR